MQLTLRHMDPEIERQLTELAHEEGLSLNKAALCLLRKGAGLSKHSPSKRIGDSLDDLIGTWSVQDEKRFLDDIPAC